MQVPIAVHSRLILRVLVKWISSPQRLPETFFCTSDLTNCVFSELFTLEEKPSLCVLIHVILQVFIYNKKETRAHLNLVPDFPVHSELSLLSFPCWLGQVSSWAPLQLDPVLKET